MPSHVALLRGINVGGHKRVTMGALRDLVAAMGYTDVTTYIQSGNVLFTSGRVDTEAMATEIEEAIAGTFGLQVPVVVLSRRDLSDVLANNPFADEPDHRCVHAVVRKAPVTPADIAMVQAAQEAARDKGSRDAAIVVGPTLYLHAPDGLGHSDLAARLTRSGAGRSWVGTARNWATVNRLWALLS